VSAFGSLLREFRIAASLTQEALAQRCRLSPVTIAALEQGRRRAPRLSSVMLIADGLGLSAAERARLAEAATSAGAATRLGAPPSSGAAGEADVSPARRELAGRGRRGVPPTPIAPLIGRLAEVARIGEQLASERLLCLTGPGGVGKTRLAVEVAAASADKFDAGTWWVELDGVADPRSVPSTVLAAIGGSEYAAAPITQQILATLPEGRVLLVIDNCEHVLDAAADLIAALLASPSVVVLATSREPLGIPGGLNWPVLPLDLPDPAPSGDPGSLLEVPSVQLFVERAWRARPGFALTGDTADPVARICRRLDGIPLAIELAAAQMQWTSPVQLADELDRHLLMHGTAARGVPERQATMTASID
jgi:transcriptional regulator with XRE-family HTH domain